MRTTKHNEKHTQYAGRLHWNEKHASAATNDGITKDLGCLDFRDAIRLADKYTLKLCINGTVNTRNGQPGEFYNGVKKLASVPTIKYNKQRCSS